MKLAGYVFNKRSRPPCQHGVLVKHSDLVYLYLDSDRDTFGCLFLLQEVVAAKNKDDTQYAG